MDFLGKPLSVCIYGWLLKATIGSLGQSHREDREP
jgi:hypothetical protein